MFNHNLKVSLTLLAICIFVLSGCGTSKALPRYSEIAKADVKSNESTTSTPSSPTIPPTIAPTLTPEPEGCKTIHNIVVCIQSVTQTELETQVKLKILVESNMVSGSGNSFIYPNYEHELYPMLLDEQGNSYVLKDSADNYWTQFDDVKRVYFQTLYFEAVPISVKNIKVSLPMVAVDSPIEAEPFQLDLGDNPQPGQTKALDVTTVIDGQSLHFVSAEFEGDGVQALRVMLYTDPLSLPDDIYSMSPLFADREKSVLLGTKQGVNGLPLQIFADLVIPPGKSSASTQNTCISGVLSLDVDRIAYWYRGPFEITFQLP